MVYNQNSHITSVADVEVFFDHLLYDRSVNFHPDTPFKDYICRATKEPSFSSEEVVLYDRLMDESFTVCERGGADIYEIGCDKLFATFDQ